MPDWGENWWRATMILWGIVDALHIQKSSLKYLLFSVAQSMSIAHHFFSWGAAKWEILLHTCFVCLYKVQPVSRLFSSTCFSLKSLCLLLTLLQPWRSMAVKWQGLEGETVFFIWRKSRQVVRHLNAFSGLKCLLYNRKLNFCFQGLYFEDFLMVALEYQALWISCRVVL